MAKAQKVAEGINVGAFKERIATDFAPIEKVEIKKDFSVGVFPGSTGLLVGIRCFKIPAPLSWAVKEYSHGLQKKIDKIFHVDFDEQLPAAELRYGDQTIAPVNVGYGTTEAVLQVNLAPLVARKLTKFEGPLEELIAELTKFLETKTEEIAEITKTIYEDLEAAAVLGQPGMNQWAYLTKKE